ncbi:hypothetical protein FB451DRAFT_1453828 [Mycena latifolia]|nr:hypothetical protein FB451DRAFT_1453828 [Mycena latifolia]
MLQDESTYVCRLWGALRIDRFTGIHSMLDQIGRELQLEAFDTCQEGSQAVLASHRSDPYVIYTLFAARASSKLLSVIVDCRCWDLYADGPSTELKEWYYSAENLLPWLDNPDARHKIGAVFVEYEHTLSLSNDFPDTLTRLRTILGRLDSLHAKDMVRPTATESAGHAKNGIEGSGVVQVDKSSPAPNIQNSASDVGGKEPRMEAESTE